jgi:hypothetical protein
LVRSLFIKLSPPSFAGGQAFLMSDAFELPGDVSVQSLMAAIVLRTSRSTAFQINANGQPPHAELRKSEQTVGTGKRNSVIAADGFEQSVFSKKPLKTRPHRRGAGLGPLSAC